MLLFRIVVVVVIAVDFNTIRLCRSYVLYSLSYYCFYCHLILLRLLTHNGLTRYARGIQSVECVFGVACVYTIFRLIQFNLN